MKKASKVGNVLAGLGIYSVPEAARLTRVPATSIHRWVRGYKYRVSDRECESHPVWHPQIEPLDGAISIGFRDLMEIRFVDAFRDAGVSWTMLRRAAQKAADEFQTSHPFSERRFRTDGKSIFVELWEEDRSRELRDLVRDQYAFGRILSPFLKDIEFENDEPRRWWPDGFKRRIVVDPTRSFGQPIVDREGVPTSVLYGAFQAENDEDMVARWFEVTLDSVRRAIEFERSLAA